jgi:hypothetical protein
VRIAAESCHPPIVDVPTDRTGQIIEHRLVCGPQPGRYKYPAQPWEQPNLKFFISEDTVKVHMKHVMDKLGANDRTQAVSIAVRRGIIEL